MLHEERKALVAETWGAIAARVAIGAILFVLTVLTLLLKVAVHVQLEAVVVRYGAVEHSAVRPLRGF